MKHRNIFGIAIAGVCLLASCYEDKGNYDYKTLNDVEVNLSLEGHSFILGDTIVIKPELNFTLGAESSDVSYTWVYGGKLLSKERNLEWIADTIATNCDLRLEVLDQQTGVAYFGSLTISVGSPYVGEGWVILSEKDNVSTLSYLRKYIENDTLKCTVTKDVYQMINKEPLGTHPVYMSFHYVNQFDSEDKVSWIWLTQKGAPGCIDISGSSYKTEGYLPSMFLSGGYPQGFDPKAVVDLRFLTLAVGEDGTAYTRVKEDDMLFNSGYFLDRPLSYNDKPVDASCLVLSPFAEHAGILLYDKNSGSYFHLCDAKDQYTSFPSGNLVLNASYSGKILPLTVYDRAYAQVPGFPRLDDMRDYTIHYISSYRSDFWGKMGYKAIVEKDGRFYVQDFTVNDFDIYDPDLIGAAPVSWEEIPLQGIVREGGQNLFSLCRYQSDAPYLLISAGKSLYLYYFKGDKLVKYDDFGAPITSLDSDNYSSRHLAVGLENGEFHVLSLSTSVVEEVLKTGDSKDKRIYKEEGFGRIIQALFKNSTSTDWGWM